MISYGSQIKHTKMSLLGRSHQLGEGRNRIAEMPEMKHPSPPVYGSQQDCTAMSPCDRSQGKGHLVFAEMPYEVHPSPPVRGGSEETHSNVAGIAPSSISFTEATEILQKCQWNDRLQREGSQR